MNQKFKREWLIGTISALMFLGVGTVARASDDITVRWDMIHVDVVSCFCIKPGGNDSATAADHTQITMTGTGTFHSGDHSFEDADGGGTWTTYDANSVMTATGTYRVTGVVAFTQALGTFPPLTDDIGNAAEASAGLLVLRIAYDDGSRGILVLACTIVGTPPSITEGITATKGYVNYANQGPVSTPVDKNHTVFHVHATHHAGD
jgi:hypothetical protein